MKATKEQQSNIIPHDEIEEELDYSKELEFLLSEESEESHEQD